MLILYSKPLDMLRMLYNYMIYLSLCVHTCFYRLLLSVLLSLSLSFSLALSFPVSVLRNVVADE